MYLFFNKKKSSNRVESKLRSRDTSICYISEIQCATLWGVLLHEKSGQNWASQKRFFTEFLWSSRKTWGRLFDLSETGFTPQKDIYSGRLHNFRWVELTALSLAVCTLTSYGRCTAGALRSSRAKIQEDEDAYENYVINVLLFVVACTWKKGREKKCCTHDNQKTKTMQKN